MTRAADRTERPSRATSQPRIRTLFFVLTARCNLTCGYCFQNDKKDLRMDWSVLQKGIDLALRSPVRTVELVFFGGEPLLEFAKIQQAVEYAAARRPPGKRVRYAMITNGTLLRDDTVRYLVQHDFEVQLSFDGVPPAQDLRGRGTFQALDRRLRLLREHHPRYFRRRLSVAMTLIPSTIPYVVDSVAYFLERGVAGISVSPTFTHACDWRQDRIAELDAQYARLLRLCLRHHRATGTTPFAGFRAADAESPHRPPASSFWPFPEAAREPQRPQRLSMCGALRGETPTVDVGGEVYACATFAKSYQRLPTQLLRDQLDAVPIGNLGDPALGEGFGKLQAAGERAEIFQDKQDKYSSYGRCGECRYLADCTVCPVSIGHIPGNQDPRRVPDFLCAFNLVALKYRARYQQRTRDQQQAQPGEARSAVLNAPPSVQKLMAFVDGARLAGRAWS